MIESVKTKLMAHDPEAVFEGVVKVQLPVGGAMIAALIYPESRTWVAHIVITDELKEFVGQDPVWGGSKTFSNATIKDGEVELKGIVTGQEW